MTAIGRTKPLARRPLGRALLWLTRLAERAGLDPSRERCGWCRTPLARGSASSFIGGRRVCDACVPRARRRMERAAYAYLALSAVFVLLGIVLALRGWWDGHGVDWFALGVGLCAAGVPVLALWTGMRIMRGQNRDALKIEAQLARANALLERAALERGDGRIGNGPSGAAG